MRERIVLPNRYGDEKDFESSIRPLSFDEFIGQDILKENLQVYIKAALQRGEALDHTILYGPPGLGKTTLANIIAKSMGKELKVTSGPVLQKAGDLAGLLTGLEQGDVLFIDEIHRLTPIVEEYLYSAMEDYSIDIMLDSGPGARSVNLALKPFTLVGATTNIGKLTSPLRARFGITCHLEHYTKENLSNVVFRSSKIFNIDLDRDAADEIGGRSRGTPRLANRYLRRVRDFAQVEEKKVIDLSITKKTLKRLDVDSAGLDIMDKRVLLGLIDKYGGGPVGLNTLAVLVNEEAEAIEDVYEPFLIQAGFLKRTPRGRVATAKAYSHFGLKQSSKESLNDGQIGLF